MQLLTVEIYLIQIMAKFQTYKQLLVLTLHTAVILGILSMETVFAHAKLMVVGLELNQIVRVSGQTFPWRFGWTGSDPDCAHKLNARAVST